MAKILVHLNEVFVPGYSIVLIFKGEYKTPFISLTGVSLLSFSCSCSKIQKRIPLSIRLLSNLKKSTEAVHQQFLDILLVESEYDDTPTTISSFKNQVLCLKVYTS